MNFSIFIMGALENEIIWGILSCLSVAEGGV